MAYRFKVSKYKNAAPQIPKKEVIKYYFMIVIDIFMLFLKSILLADNIKHIIFFSAMYLRDTPWTNYVIIWKLCNL